MDKVKLYPQERLDLDDTRALQALVYDYVEEALGSIMGHNRGVLSVPLVTSHENNGSPYFTLSPFTFVASTPVEASGRLVTTPSIGTELNLFKDVVVTYFPTEQATNQISFDTERQFYQESISKGLWARPVYIDTDTATRRKWDVSAGAEVSFSDETRESQRVELTFSFNEPTYASGESKWTKIAVISGFTDDDNTGSEIELTFKSAWDAPPVSYVNEILDGAGDVVASEISTDRIQTALAQKPFDNGRSYRSLDLPSVLSALRGQLARILGDGSAYKWYSAPVQDLVEITNRLIALEAQPSGGVYAIATGRVGGYLDAGSQQKMNYVLETSTNRNVKAVYSLANGNPQNRVNIELADSLFATGSKWLITHVSCTQLRNSSFSNGDHDFNRVTFLVANSSFGDTQQANTVLLDSILGTKRGVIIDILPHVVDTTSGHDEDAIELPDGVTTGTTPLLTDLSSPSPFTLRDVVFSFTVFAVPYT